MNDTNITLSSNGEMTSEKFKLLQSIKRKAAIVIYERAYNKQNVRDDLVELYKFKKGRLILVGHEKFESK